MTTIPSNTVVYAPVPILGGRFGKLIIGGTEMRECQVVRQTRYRGEYWLHVIGTRRRSLSARYVVANRGEIEVML